MDPFEVRMQFIALLKRLNASQQSIQKVVGYALKYFSRCGEDLWECIVEECQKGSLNTRINILYLLDSLCENSLLMSGLDRNQSTTNTNAVPTYVQYVSRDLDRIVQLVVPDSRDGLMNLQSAAQILENWRIKRVLDPQTLEEVIETLDRRKANLKALPAPQIVESKSSSHRESFNKSEVFKRIEEDRERHKRLRERRWVQPIDRTDTGAVFSRLATFMPNSVPGTQNPSPSSLNTSPVSPNPHPSYPGNGHGLNSLHGSGSITEPALDIEFENAWETTSDWNEDDEEAVQEENLLCFPELAHSDNVMDVS